VRDDIDILVTSGGVSVGDKDVVRMLLGESAEVKFRRVFMKPGKPLTFAVDRDLVIFGLPGNPVSSMVSLELFVRPAINKMLGRVPVVPDRVHVTLATDIKRSDRLEFQRVTVRVDGTGKLLASSTGNQISSRLASMLNANALIVIDAGTDTIPAGTVVEAILLDLPRSA
jgi:molybdopterin biosynthesis enzyme